MLNPILHLVCVLIQVEFVANLIRVLYKCNPGMVKTNFEEFDEFTNEPKHLQGTSELRLHAKIWRALSNYSPRF